jgi:hypothetical protein
MLRKTKIIVAITGDKIVGARVKLARQNKIEKSIAFGWKPETLDMVLSKMKTQLKAKRIRVLIGDDLSYVLRLTMPSTLGKKEEKEYLAKKISEQIPEELSDTQWDYKELYLDATKKPSKEEKKVVVFSPVKGFFEKLSRALEKLDLVVEAIEPEVIAKTRDTDPIIGLAMKKDIKGKDEDVLNIEPLETVTVENEDESEELLTEEARRMEKKAEGTKQEDSQKEGIKKVESRKKKYPLARKLLTAALLLVALVVVLILIFFYISGIRKETDFTQSSETTEESVEEKGSDEAEKVETEREPKAVLSEYKVQILNGSGIAGEALVVSEILQAEGFVDIEMANAASYDYTNTEIKLKEQVPEKVYSTLNRALDSEYLLKRLDSYLDSGSDFDVVIVAGQRRE